MNLYLLSQNENNGYDTYDSMVVIARNEIEAKNITAPYQDWSDTWTTWASHPDKVSVTLIGKAVKGLTGDDEENPNIILASFNAG